MAAWVAAGLRRLSVYSVQHSVAGLLPQTRCLARGCGLLSPRSTAPRLPSQRPVNIAEHHSDECSTCPGALQPGVKKRKHKL